MSTLKAVFGSCKSIFGKYSIFWKCYFPERKMFPCIWLYFKKFSEKYFLVFGKVEGKDKSRKTQATTQKKKSSTIDWVRRRDASRAPVRRPCRPSRSEIAIAIDGVISQRRDRDRRRDLVKRRLRSRKASITISDLPLSRVVVGSSSLACGRRTGSRSQSRSSVLPLSPACSLSLSLSLLPEILWSENESVKGFPESKPFFFGQRKSISGK